jgi:Ca2+-binding EF-hand superfamily protein
MYFD